MGAVHHAHGLGAVIGEIVFILLLFFMCFGIVTFVRRLVALKRGYVRYPPCPHCGQRVQVPVGRKTSLRHTCGHDVTVEVRGPGRRTSLEPAAWRLEQMQSVAQDTHIPNPREAQPGTVRSRREPYWWAPPAVSPTPSVPPAGWYPDPQNPSQRRWWDGRQWTDHVEPPTRPETGPPKYPTSP